jgi:uncharacterized protein YchJ
MEEETRREPAADEPCPCGSGLAYAECCGRPEAAAVPAAEDAETEVGSADE